VLTGGAGLVMRVESPCRADLAGGTLDIWPLGMLHPGSLTVNAAIPVMVRMDVDLGAPEGEVWHAMGKADWTHLDASVATTDLSAAVAFAVRPAGGVRIRVHSQASLGSGLGGSSSYAVALARGILTALGEEMEDERLVLLTRDLEARVLGVPTGLQDHWAAVHGGVLAIHHEPGGERVERLTIEPEWVGERLTIFDTGITHHSGMVNWQVIRRRLDGDRGTSDALESIADAARRCRAELISGNENGVGRAMADEWDARRRLAPEVCPPELGAIIDAGLGAGATAIKAGGAGGGGSVLVWHPPAARRAIATALATAAPNGQVVATEIVKVGCRVLAGG
jgi:D-glycero-alpha-D-manno-heptose-7-phosphate kinase